MPVLWLNSSEHAQPWLAQARPRKANIIADWGFPGNPPFDSHGPAGRKTGALNEILVTRKIELELSAVSRAWLPRRCA